MQYNTFIFKFLRRTKEFVAESLVKKACHNSCGMSFGQMRPKYWYLDYINNFRDFFLIRSLSLSLYVLVEKFLEVTDVCLFYVAALYKKRFLLLSNSWHNIKVQREQIHSRQCQACLECTCRATWCYKLCKKRNQRSNLGFFRILILCRWHNYLLFIYLISTNTWISLGSLRCCSVSLNFFSLSFPFCITVICSF